MNESAIPDAQRGIKKKIFKKIEKICRIPTLKTQTELLRCFTYYFLFSCQKQKFSFLLTRSVNQQKISVVQQKIHITG